jgi:mono/diheme cytochrome c family protein
LVVIAAAILFGGSAALMRRSVDVALPTIKASTNPGDITEGGRLAAIQGCTRCHGDQGQGRMLTGTPHLGQIVAPSLSRVAAGATDGQMGRAIRNGVGVDARPLFVMPSRALNALADEDLARTLGWMRVLPTSAFDVIGSTAVGVRGRFAILTGSMPDSVDQGRQQPKRRPTDVGRYFTRLACQQCHALDHEETTGAGKVSAPALASAARAYDATAFRTLVRNGAASGGRTLPIMAGAAADGMDMLSDAEIEAMRLYLLGIGSQQAGK